MQQNMYGEVQKESLHRVQKFYIAFVCTFIGVITGYSGYDVYEAFGINSDSQ